jgi:hypothetical protein
MKFTMLPFLHGIGLRENRWVPVFDFPKTNPFFINMVPLLSPLLSPLSVVTIVPWLIFHGHRDVVFTKLPRQKLTKIDRQASHVTLPPPLAVRHKAFGDPKAKINLTFTVPGKMWDFPHGKPMGFVGKIIYKWWGFHQQTMGIHWGFQKWGYPFNAGWFIRENHIKMDDDWGTPIYGNHHMSRYEMNTLVFEMI